MEKNGTVMDYLRWRGDLPFTRDGFNEVDDLVLCIISYINFRRFEDLRTTDPTRAVALPEVAARLTKEDEQLGLSELDYIPLMRLAAETERFREVRMFGFTHEYDEVKEMQFDAVSYLLPDDTLLVSFMGTDTSLVGWKEDFNMSYLSAVPAQIRAAAYTEEIAAACPDRGLRIGGHSKGGNLAAWAAIHIPAPLQDPLLAAYNNDGPGFRTSLLGLPEHKRVADRITTILPESSVVGMLLEHEERYEVVRSTQSGLWQHDGFSWQVRGERFEHLPDLTEGGKLVDETIRTFILSLSPEQRVAFTDALFDILTCTDAGTLTDLKEGGLKTAAAMLKKYRTLDKPTRSALGSTLRLFMAAGAKTAASELNPVSLLLRHLPLQKLADGLEKP